MSTPDYTAQAQALLAGAQILGPRTGWDDPIWTVDLIDDLNTSIDVGAATEADARTDAGVVAIVAKALEARAG